MDKEQIQNIFSKKTIILFIYIIGFLLLVLNFSTNLLNLGGNKDLANMNSFLYFQSDSEYLTLSKIINDKYDLKDSKYGLLILKKDNAWINYDYILNNNLNFDKEQLKDFDVSLYKSQVGIQGYTISFLYNKLHLGINKIRIILVSLLAVILLYICKYIAKKFNKKLAFIFFIVFLLSPWICAFARNLYWVEFTWFLPMLFGLILSINYKNKKILIPCIFISIFIKCLCGYEYITVIMLSTIIFMLYDFIFQKANRKEIFKTIIVVGVTALLGFLSALMIHSYIRGNGNIISGINIVYNEDVTRRTLAAGGTEEFTGIVLESLKASPLTTLKKYFSWNTNIISGISGSFFILLFVSSAFMLIFNLLIKKKNSINDLILYILFFITCISWFILASPHSYIHTHMNYVLWYFGFIQFMLYIIVDFIINIIFNNKKNKAHINYKEVPKHKIKEYQKKQNKYCLCIPTIDEGDRILKELTVAKENNINKLLDIIICDGGSTDGSTNDKEMKKLGVNTLLTKTDIGKQGAQLRMGFSYALERGYDGIITIDGNNKDSIEDIPGFIKKLEDGYDFVQGSRFIKGGKAINTPPIRYISVRLLHAPIISLTAGEKFTDTTNNYRAYSRKYLTHKDVQPLRNIFQTYELLAYLSVRASQLGLKTCEIPVRREYPSNVKTPTKISGFKGNYELFKILFLNAIGRYDPWGEYEDEI